MIGIDIGSTSLKLAQVGKRGVEQLAIELLPENLVQDGRIVSFEAMGSFIKDSVQKHRMKGKCAIVLPTGMAFIRRINMPLMTIDQLEVNLPFEFRDYLEQDKEKFIFDYSVLSLKEATEENQGSMELLAVAVPKEIIENYRSMFRRAGLSLQVVAPMECAFANLIQNIETDKETPADYCIADIGHLSTHLYMFNGSAFDTVRAIDIGNIHIDRAIANDRAIDDFVARSHKENNMQNALNSEAVHDVFENISVEAMRAINFYGFNNPNSHLENIYFCGGGANINELLESVQRATQLEIHGIEELLPQTSSQDKKLIHMCTAAIGIACQ